MGTRAGGNERKARFVLPWLAVVIPQAWFCAAFALLPHISTRAVRTPFACGPPARCSLPGSVSNPRRCQPSPPPPRPPQLLSSLRRSRILDTVRRRPSHSSCLFGAADATGSGSGGSSSKSKSKSNVRAREQGVEAETRRLMSVPTIDIKLELQMRGVDHRDSFEKVDLARRLAESRVSSPFADGPSSTARTTTADDGNGAGGGKSWDTVSPSPVPSASGSGRARSNVNGGGESSRGGGDDPSNKPSLTSASETASQAAAGEERKAKGAGQEHDEVHARDVAKAMRMGKQAVTRELNVLGIAHSRLSDLPVLARQYASARQEARSEAHEARRFRAERGLDEPQGIRGGRDGGTRDGEGGGEEGRGSGWHRWGAGARWSQGNARLPWTARKPREEEEEEEEEGASDGPKGRRRFAWGTAGEAETPRDNSEGARSGSDWSLSGNAGSEISEDGVEARQPGAGDGRRREASLQARADRMSSRELMNVLDDLSASYRIPAPRSELQQAFVSAVLEQESGAVVDASRGGGGARDGGGHDGSAEIVPLSPYAGEDEGPRGEPQRLGFDTYHSALRWARQLTFDDVLEELRYRGVRFDPRADYSYLTRLLAEGVLADEQLMEEEDTEAAYRAEVESAMSMSAQEIIRALREGGEQADVTLSKEALAEQFAAMMVRLRDERLQGDGRSPPREREWPNPSSQHSSSSTAYRRRPQEGRRRDSGGSGSQRGNDFASSALAAGMGDLLRFGDDEQERGDDDALLELEEAARSIGGAAWAAVQETASLLTGTAAGLFPEAFPEGHGTGAPTAEGAPGPRQRRQAGGGSPGGRAKRAKAVRERASGVRRAAGSFAQSSANRAGLAVVRSAANGALRGAEAAAEWAGGGALSSEHVLLFIAAFCLVFKRGVGSSVALLVVIRAGRITAQRLLSGGWAAAQSRRNARGGTASSAATAGAAQSAGATARRRSGRSGGGSFGRRATPDSARMRRRPNPSRRGGPKKARPGAGEGPKKGDERPGKRGRGRRKPLWDESDDDSEKGCVVM